MKHLQLHGEGAAPHRAPCPRDSWLAIVCVLPPSIPPPTFNADYFSPSERVWASLPLLGQPRSFAAAVGTGAGRAAAAAAHSIPVLLVLQAHPPTQPTCQLSSLPTCHTRLYAHPPALSRPDPALPAAAEVFVAGGGNGVEWFDSVVRYDRQAGLMGGWVELAPLQVARGSLAAGVANGYLFAYGGGKPKEQYNVVEW